MIDGQDTEVRIYGAVSLKFGSAAVLHSLFWCVVKDRIAVPVSEFI